MTVAPSEKRVYVRQRVSREAECRVGGSRLTGAIRDESEGGVFFVPLGVNDDASTTLPYEPELGDTVVLAYPEEPEPALALATIRWRGFSREHGCEGLGLMFDDG